MKSVITRLEADNENMTLGSTPYVLELKDKPEPRVKVRKVQDLNKGGFEVQIEAPADIAVSTLDAIARRLIPQARVKVAGKNHATIIRYYS